MQVTSIQQLFTEHLSAIVLDAEEIGMKETYKNPGPMGAYILVEEETVKKKIIIISTLYCMSHML